MQKGLNEAILSVVEERFADYQLTVESLAKEVGVGVSYLREIVHSQYCMSPHELIEAVRLEKAMKLIFENPKSNLYQLSSYAGYLHVRTFLDSFKRRIGMTPTEWKASLSGDGQSELELEETLKRLWMTNENGENHR